MKVCNCHLILKKAVNQVLSITIIAALSLIISCGTEDDEPALEGKYSINDLTGSWTAIQAFFSSIEAVNKGSINIVDEGGTLTLLVQSNGKFTLTISLPGEPDNVTTGKLGFDEEWLAVSYDDDPGEYDYMFIEMDESKVILTIRGDGAYDFDDDGVEDPASLDFALKRN